MPIKVTCPGCLARFTVSDKYAGMKGPCPKCKKELIVPDKSQEVVIHAPEDAAPKDSKGVSVLKPLRRIDFKFNQKDIILYSVVAVLAIIGAIIGRVSLTEHPWWFASLGVILLAAPLTFAGYQLLFDDELGSFVGKELLARTAICSSVFALTWGLYWLLAYYLGSKVLSDVDGVQFGIFVALMFIIGTFASLLAFEITLGQSVLHYAMFFGITLLLAIIAGYELCEPLAFTKPKNTINIPGLPPIKK